MHHQHLNTKPITDLPAELISSMVTQALREDIQTGDITAELIPTAHTAIAHIITRENMVVCGKEWVNQAFQQIDHSIQFDWSVKDGDQVAADTRLATITGNARSLLTAERTALNFLQLLSATATQTRQYVDLIAHTKARLLDTRKTIPGFRLAQKYAVYCGGGKNHRIGLFDGFLIKENHINATGSIAAAVSQARLNHPNKLIEVEVENLDELLQAIDAQSDVIMLDNFSIKQLYEAVEQTNNQAQLEASGNVSLTNIRKIAETGVNFISVGEITKNIQAIDLSMRIQSIINY